jgi:hypothetical protein
MTPRTPEHLIAIWVALEDAHEDAGQLEYYPGSHKIEQMIFGNGTRHFEPAEMTAWHAYMESEVAKAGLEKSTFSARKGDVFVWHSNLLHGGGPIADPVRTRKSLVFHYFSNNDAANLNLTLRPMSCGFWIDRPIQDVPQEAFERSRFEEAYLAKYPDVAQAVRDNAFVSGRQHYDLFGKAEGRTV